ncbi:hypothetical protein RIR_jg20644.t1 [Rhizophagus irregularis DAOM 181602=DAOM 197198]|nr:hypothetical protein RIR_jg20644.t1 [Rhizophagus irregularis DAOM 181602=DAOM 197198]
MAYENYVTLLKGMLSTSDNFSAIKFFKIAYFTASQRKRAEETLFETLKIIEVFRTWIEEKRNQLAYRLQWITFECARILLEQKGYISHT